MRKLEKYDSYKESGVEWLGEIPEHWEVKRIKHLFQIGRGRVISQQELDYDGKYPVYSSQTKDNGVLGYIKTFDFDCKQITWTTDGANAGTVFLREGKHNCTNVCGTLQNRNKNEVLEFVNYSLQIAAQFYKRPDTNGAKIMNNEMAGIFITYPPKEEQSAIASFLDTKIAQIDQAIRQKEQLIELLKERRQIVINDAVTKSLDKNVEFVDSGVEWIGKIPKHWEVSKLGVCLKPISIKNRTDLPLLSVTREQGIILRDVEDKESNHNFIPDDLSSYKMVKKGQFAMNKMKA
jgi:type I restriction enzyme S subunit